MEMEYVQPKAGDLDRIAGQDLDDLELHAPLSKREAYLARRAERERHGGAEKEAIANWRVDISLWVNVDGNLDAEEAVRTAKDSLGCFDGEFVSAEAG